MDITAVRGDITAQQVDAVVNAANAAMRGGGGVDGAIHRAGGPAILEDCVRRFPSGLATGDAGWTTAGDLPARWVIHVVGPNRHAGETDRGLLLSCYSRALEVADELGAATVAVGWSAYVVSFLRDIGIQFPPLLSAAPGTAVILADGSSTTALFNLPAMLVSAAATLLLIVGTVVVVVAATAVSVAVGAWRLPFA